MKPKIELFLNSICLFVLSPLLGMMAVGIAVGIIEILIWTVAGCAGLMASIFFDVDFSSVHNWRSIQHIKIAFEDLICR